MIAQIRGKIISAENRTFVAQDGQNAGREIEYTRLTLQDDRGQLEISFDPKKGRELFEDQKGREEWQYTPVIIIGNLTTYKGQLKFKGTEIEHDEED